MMKLLFQRVLAILFVCCASAGFAAFDAYLKIEGVDGEAIAPGHTNWIQVLDMTNLVAPGTVAGAGPSSSFCLKKAVDKSSPKLNLYCANGTAIPSMNLELLQVLPSGVRFFDITFSNVLVTSVQVVGQSAAVDPKPAETVCFNFARAAWTYTVRRQSNNLPATSLSSFWSFANGAGGSSSNLPVFKVTGIQKNPGTVLLQWQAIQGKTYDVYSASSILGAFSQQRQLTAAADGPMSHTATILPGAEFFVVEERP